MGKFGVKLDHTQRMGLRPAMCRNQEAGTEV